MTDSLTISNAQKILNEYTCLNLKSVQSADDKEKVHQALQTLIEASDYQLLGICANSPSEAMKALTAYLQVLGYAIPSDFKPNLEVAGAIYLKFNGLKQTCHLDSYQGDYRGVLISCQSSDPEGVNGTYGYLPLDLFD